MFGTITIPLGRKAVYGTLNVNTDEFNDEVQRHIYDYGLRQILNDAMAQKFETGDDGKSTKVKLVNEIIVAKAQKRLDALLRGDLRRTSDEPFDPVEKELYRLVRENRIAAWKKSGAWAVPKNTKNRFLFVANKIATMGGKPGFENSGDFIEDFLGDEFSTLRKNFTKLAERNVAEAEEMAELAAEIV
jgi:hypothetical protein